MQDKQEAPPEESEAAKKEALPDLWLPAQAPGHRSNASADDAPPEEKSRPV